MKKIITAVMLVILTIISFSGCTQVQPADQKTNEPPQAKVTNYKECVAAGNPILESAPRQCYNNGVKYVEEITLPGEDGPITLSSMTEADAKVIAEKSCIKGGDALSSGGSYNENSKTWWFDANLNATKPGCNPACVVSEETKTAEINWRCTGLIVPEQTTEAAIQKLFAEKYPKYADTVTVKVSSEAENHARGSVTFVEGEAGGIFLAAKVDGNWKIVHDGNGAIPCTLSSYDFPKEMLADCAE